VAIVGPFEVGEKRSIAVLVVLFGRIVAETYRG
jgi:hypothetical protein